jgi:hypothetical protein
MPHASRPVAAKDWRSDHGDKSGKEDLKRLYDQSQPAYDQANKTYGDARKS